MAVRSSKNIVAWRSPMTRPPRKIKPNKFNSFFLQQTNKQKTIGPLWIFCCKEIRFLVVPHSSLTSNPLISINTCLPSLIPARLRQRKIRSRGVLTDLVKRKQIPFKLRLNPHQNSYHTLPSQ
jgi:hypothetical protein